MKSLRKYLLNLITGSKDVQKVQKKQTISVTLYEKYPLWDSKQSYLYV